MIQFVWFIICYNGEIEGLGRETETDKHIVGLPIFKIMQFYVETGGAASTEGKSEIRFNAGVSYGFVPCSSHGK